MRSFERGIFRASYRKNSKSWGSRSLANSVWISHTMSMPRQSGGFASVLTHFGAIHSWIDIGFPS
jgi:hypothetical protein